MRTKAELLEEFSAQKKAIRLNNYSELFSLYDIIDLVEASDIDEAELKRLTKVAEAEAEKANRLGSRRAWNRAAEIFSEV